MYWGNYKCSYESKYSHNQVMLKNVSKNCLEFQTATHSNFNFTRKDVESVNENMIVCPIIGALCIPATREKFLTF